RGNRFELGQVFLNLFNNAVDAMPGGGQIRVSARVADDNLLILVKDSGRGIPADLLDKVMEPFFTTKEVGKGTGLGLSISHGIIEEHSGTMRVRNHPEGGAEFEIRLPLPGEPPPGEKESR
ncbi:MAG TPA: ATP-binding protein, partial [Bdellovibrionota bacterium]|nr:ATP-binding protein [Bdellovibrionota bacterium]